MDMDIGSSQLNTRQYDIFAVPIPHHPEPGRCRYGQEASKLISRMIGESGAGDRYAIAAELSRKSGKEVSKHMLDAYASPSRQDHAMPFWMAPILEEVCQSQLLTNWLAEKRGGRVAYGYEALKQELGKLVLLKDHAVKDLNKRIRQIENFLSMKEA